MKMQLKVNGIKVIATLSKNELLKKVIRIIDDFIGDDSAYCEVDILNQTNAFVDKQKLNYFLQKQDWNASVFIEKSKNDLELVVETM